jgi:hypothetical protein
MTKYIADISSVHKVSEKEKKLLETVWSDDEIKQWLIKQVMDNNIEFLGIHYDNDGEELENVDLGGLL